MEIQVRSPLQHLWAEFSEKLSDIIDPNIKYGGGEEQIRQMLTKLSDLMAVIEATEIIMASLPKQDLSEQQAMVLQGVKTRIVQDTESKINYLNLLNEMVSRLENQKGQKG